MASQTLNMAGTCSLISSMSSWTASSPDLVSQCTPHLEVKSSLSSKHSLCESIILILLASQNVVKSKANLLIALGKVQSKTLDLRLFFDNICEHSWHLPLIQLGLIKAEEKLPDWIELEFKLHAYLFYAIRQHSKAPVNSDDPPPSSVA